MFITKLGRTVYRWYNSESSMWFGKNKPSLGYVFYHKTREMIAFEFKGKNSISGEIEGDKSYFDRPRKGNPGRRRQGNWAVFSLAW